MVATDRANDLKIRWVHSPHLCRTLAHRVVRVGRLLQTGPKCLVSFATAITVQVFLRMVLAILPLETADTFSRKILRCA
jgi:hypothetical protein